MDIVEGGSIMTEPVENVLTFITSVDTLIDPAGKKWQPMDYRPMWEGEILVGFEVFCYEQPLAP